MTDEQYFAFQYWSSLRAAAQRDLPSACCRFGIDMRMAEVIAGLSIPDLDRLSLQVELVVLKPVVTAEQIITILGPARFPMPNSARIFARLIVGASSGRPRTSNKSNPAKTGDIENGKTDSKARRQA